MAVTKIADRQYPLTALVVLTKDNVGAGNEVTVKIPPGALVTAVGLFTATAFNGTTPTATVTDGTTVYVNAQDISSTGNETSAGAPKHYPTGGTITFSAANAGGSTTAGKALGTVTYVIENRGGELQN